MNALTNFFDLEDIIAKVNGVEQELQSHRYEPTENNARSYWSRMQRTVELIPPEHRAAAYAILANVVYLTNEFMSETMRLLASELSDWCSQNNIDIREEIHFFAVDHTSLIQDIRGVGGPFGLGSRQDYILERYINLPTHLVNTLRPDQVVTEQNKARVRDLLGKRAWVLLTDNAFSGTSVSSDVKRLRRIAEMFGLGDTNPIKIIVLAQLITNQARISLEREIPRSNIKYGMEFDDRFRISSEKCELFHSAETLRAVRELCKWFGKSHFSSIAKERYPDSRAALNETLRLHREAGGEEHFSYGWLDGGYTIVLQANAPTNSIPILWYPLILHRPQLPLVPIIDPNEDSHVALFPRNHSRTKQRTAGDSTSMEQIVVDQDAIRKILRS